MRRLTARASREEGNRRARVLWAREVRRERTLVTGAGGGVLTTYAICAEACAASTVTPALRAHMITV